MAFVKKIKVYSIENGSTFAMTFPNPMQAEIDTLEDQIEFLKRLKVTVAPGNFYIIYSFNSEEDWDNYKDELIDYLSAKIDDSPSEPDETFFMLPLDYETNGETK